MDDDLYAVRHGFADALARWLFDREALHAKRWDQVSEATRARYREADAELRAALAGPVAPKVEMGGGLDAALDSMQPNTATPYLNPGGRPSLAPQPGEGLTDPQTRWLKPLRKPYASLATTLAASARSTLPMPHG